jgi:quercetin dioxygenase-like cupin family protein
MSRSTLFDPTQAGILHLAEATQFSDTGVVSRALHDEGGVRVTLFAFAAGQRVTEHSTPARALVQILSGTCEFTLAGKKTPLRAGNLLHMPPGFPHAVFATEAFSMLLITVREKGTTAEPQPS